MVVDGVIDDEGQMKPTVRHKPLAQCFLFGMAGLMTGGYAVDVQAEPLRIDPALLAPELREAAREAPSGAVSGGRAEALETVQTGPVPANTQTTTASRAPRPTISAPAPVSSAAVDSVAPPARRLMLRLSLRHLPLFRQPRMLRPLPLRRRHRHPARPYPPSLRCLRPPPCSTPIRLRFLHGRQMRSHTKHRPPNRPPRPCRMSIRPCWGILLHISHRPDRRLRLLLLKCRRRLWPLPLHPPNLPLPARRRACRRLPAPRPHLGPCRRIRDRAERRVSPIPLLPWLCVVRPRYRRRPRQIEKMPVRPS